MLGRRAYAPFCKLQSRLRHCDWPFVEVKVMSEGSAVREGRVEVVRLLSVELSTLPNHCLAGVLAVQELHLVVSPVRVDYRLLTHEVSYALDAVCRLRVKD